MTLSFLRASLKFGQPGACIGARKRPEFMLVLEQQTKGVVNYQRIKTESIKLT